MLHFVTWGGGGWGDPLDRGAALVALEVKRGLVTEAGAAAYGVVCSAAGVLDAAATEAKRAEMRRGRNDLAVFDRGPSIEELRASCLADTGLPAPVQPVWRKFAA
jgi:N-methylhydantoinase B